MVGEHTASGTGADGPDTFCAAFQATADRHPDAPALSTPDGPVITWRTYRERVHALAAGLAGLGVRRGDTVALMLANRPEFHIADTAALHVGATPFSVYNTLSAEQVAYLFGNAGNRVVICEAQFATTVLAAAAGTVVEHVVCVDTGPDGAVPDGTIPLADVLAAPTDGFDVGAAWRAVEPADVLTIIYTSGTTGPPKGVELTHANMLAEVRALSALSGTTVDDSIVSYLPDAHVANRWGAHYTSLVTGMHVITLADLRQLVASLPQVRPTLFGAVPQVWYRVKAAIEAALDGETNPVKQRLGAWAIDVGRAVARRRSDRAAVPVLLRAQHALAERIVLRPLRARLGLDRVRFAATGAAAISTDALEFVLGLGIPCCEVWGMSETSAVALLNRPGQVRIGTVGTVVPGSEVRLADDGELLVRGPLIMKGYRDDPERTAETIDDDGWLHTGDIATIDDDGYVTIVDRKKELIVNASGKNMSPANIEGLVQVSCPLAGPVAVIGNDRPYLVALVTLDPEAAATFAQEHDLDPSDLPALANDRRVRAAIQRGVDAANERLSRVEQVRRFAVLPDTWAPGSDVITPTMKLRRRPIDDRYASVISELYRADPR